MSRLIVIVIFFLKVIVIVGPHQVCGDHDDCDDLHHEDHNCGL